MPNPPLTEPAPETVTQLLDAVSEGQGPAQEKLWSLIYSELHALARRQLANEAPGPDLQATSLVHEAYIRLVGSQTMTWANRRHFFAAAANAMRRIRIDEARKRHRLKRGGDYRRVPLEEAAAALDDDPAELMALDEAMNRLEAIDPRKAQIVSLRYFAGLTVEETAEALELSPRTIESDWHFARAWLHRELRSDDTSA